MIAGALLLLVGLAVMGAEVWLATQGAAGLALALLALTAFTEYIVFTEWWGDVRP